MKLPIRDHNDVIKFMRSRSIGDWITVSENIYDSNAVLSTCHPGNKPPRDEYFKVKILNIGSDSFDLSHNGQVKSMNYNRIYEITEFISYTVYEKHSIGEYVISTYHGKIGQVYVIKNIHEADDKVDYNLYDLAPVNGVGPLLSKVSSYDFVDAAVGKTHVEFDYEHRRFTKLFAMGIPLERFCQAQQRWVNCTVITDSFANALIRVKQLSYNDVQRIRLENELQDLGKQSKGITDKINQVQSELNALIRK